MPLVADQCCFDRRIDRNAGQIRLGGFNENRRANMSIELQEEPIVNKTKSHQKVRRNLAAYENWNLSAVAMNSTGIEEEGFISTLKGGQSLNKVSKLWNVLATK